MDVSVSLSKLSWWGSCGCINVPIKVKLVRLLWVYQWFVKGIYDQCWYMLDWWECINGPVNLIKFLWLYKGDNNLNDHLTYFWSGGNILTVTLVNPQCGGRGVPTTMWGRGGVMLHIDSCIKKIQSLRVKLFLKMFVQTFKLLVIVYLSMQRIQASHRSWPLKWFIMLYVLMFNSQYLK